MEQKFVMGDDVLKTDVLDMGIKERRTAKEIWEQLKRHIVEWLGGTYVEIKSDKLENLRKRIDRDIPPDEVARRILKDLGIRVPGRKSLEEEKNELLNIAEEEQEYFEEISVMRTEHIQELEAMIKQLQEAETNHRSNTQKKVADLKKRAKSKQETIEYFKLQ